MSVRRIHLAAALGWLVLVGGCRCAGGGCHGQTPRASTQPFVWDAQAPLGDVPADGVAASLLGESFVVGHVQIGQEEDDASRLEITDRPPEDLCGPVVRGEGFSVRFPGPVSSATTIAKAMEEHPHGVSAFMVERQEDGSVRSVMAGAFALALEITEVDREAGWARGRIALMFDDPQKSGASGTFRAKLCTK